MINLSYIKRKRMIETRKYSMSQEEYFYFLLEKEKIFKKISNGLKEDFYEEESRYRILEELAEYEEEKKYYDNLTEQQKLKYEIGLFSDQLDIQSKDYTELEKIFDGKLTSADVLGIYMDAFNSKHFKNVLDSMYFKKEKVYEKGISESSFYRFFAELEIKEKLYENIISNNIKGKYFDPPITSAQIRKLSLQMIYNEILRLNQNLNIYNFFISNLSNYYSNEDDILCIPDNNQGIKTSILMFLLVTDYEKNISGYDNYDLSFISPNYIASKNSNGVDDDFTVKAKNKQISKMLRDAASHGEFYLNNDSTEITIVNSRFIPRIDFQISYNQLYNFVVNNLTEDTKNKYKFLINLLELSAFEIGKCSKADIKELMVFMLNNTVQYNYDHHFKPYAIDEEGISSFIKGPNIGGEYSIAKGINFSSFTFFDMINGGIEITSTIDTEKKMSIIKNALGHDNVYWDLDNIVVENIWNPSRGRTKHDKGVASFESIIEFFVNQDLYDVSLISKYDNFQFRNINKFDFSKLKL